MRSLKICAAMCAAAAFTSCASSEGGSSSDAAKQAIESERKSTYAERLTENIATGSYAMDMVVSGGSFGEQTPYKLVAHEGDIKVAMTFEGVYTEFYTIDGTTYMVIPDICFYQKSDGQAMPIDSLFVIGDGDTLAETSSEDGVVTEIYTADDEEGGTDTYTFTFDEESGDLKSFYAENGGAEVSVQVNSLNWVGAEIELPDLEGWQDMSSIEELDEDSKLKLSFYYMGITEELLEEKGYTYEQLLDMDDEQLQQALADLGVNIFN